MYVCNSKREVGLPGVYVLLSLKTLNITFFAWLAEHLEGLLKLLRMVAMMRCAAIIDVSRS